jgi:ArsR family transcriptional regulator, arsenate/arsenite/antimonite-responsive transcriptional repressor
MRIGLRLVETLAIVDCCTPLSGSTLSVEDAVELERLFKTLADRSRLRILNVLLEAGGEAVCVCEFQPTLGIAQPTVSHHLKQLVQAGLLEREKRGTFAYYRLKPGALERIRGLLAESPVRSPAES